MEGTLSVREAAERLGVSKDTIRRRIKSGDLAAVQEATAQGFEWRVTLNGKRAAELRSEAAQLGNDHAQLGSTAAKVGSDTNPTLSNSDERLEKALELVEKVQQDYTTIHKENLELAARCGYLQARLEASERQVLALTAPQEPERTSIPWWRRLLGMEPA